MAPRKKSAGEVVTLLGRNGMGKTTTVMSIMGLLKPRAGRVTIEGEVVTGAAPYRIAQRGLGLVPEGRQVFPTLSVEQNLVEGRLDGTRAIALGVRKQPGSNTVATIDEINRRLDALRAGLPAGMRLDIHIDRSQSIRDSIHDVKVTLAITCALVILVIFLFLRHPTATIIPTLSLPISLIGTLALMKWMGYTLDNISLLAITLAVGIK